MDVSSVQKIARVLKCLVTVTFVCNLAALPLVPVLARQKYVDLRLYQELLWDRSLVWQDVRAVVLMVFLWFCGCCTAVILWQARQVLNSILTGRPFCGENARSLRRAALCGFLIAAGAFGRMVFSICFYESFRPILTYNALFVPIFAVFGLLCLIMSALFRQAAEIKTENDLTI